MKWWKIPPKPPNSDGEAMKLRPLVQVFLLGELYQLGLNVGVTLFLLYHDRTTITLLGWLLLLGKFQLYTIPSVIIYTILYRYRKVKRKEEEEQKRKKFTCRDDDKEELGATGQMVTKAALAVPVKGWFPSSFTSEKGFRRDDVFRADYPRDNSGYRVVLILSLSHVWYVLEKDGYSDMGPRKEAVYKYHTTNDLAQYYKFLLYLDEESQKQQADERLKINFSYLEKFLTKE